MFARDFLKVCCIVIVQSMSMAFLSQYHHLSCSLGTFSKVSCIVLCLPTSQSMSMAFLSQYHHLSCLLGTFSKVCCIVIVQSMSMAFLSQYHHLSCLLGTYVYGLPFTVSSSLMFARDFLKGKIKTNILISYQYICWR